VSAVALLIGIRMKAFFIGLLFLLFAMLMMGLGVLLWPLLVVLGLALRLALFVLLTVFAIWLMGKLIIAVWESLRSKNESK